MPSLKLGPILYQQKGGLSVNKALIVFGLFLVSVSAKSEMQISDPTRPLDYQVISKTQENQLSLQAIFSGNGGASKAIINGELLSEGQKIESWNVTSITSQEVSLKSGSKSKKLFLRKSVIK